MATFTIQYTRKDYVETAKILADTRESILSLGVEGENIFDNLVADFSVMFKDDNPKFLGDKFVDACWEEN
jgi:hypothetical protein